MKQDEGQNKATELDDLPVTDEQAEATKGASESLTLNDEGFNPTSAQKRGNYTWSYITRRPS